MTENTTMAAEVTVLNPGGGVFQKMSEVEPEAVEWTVPGLIPNGEITLLCGDGGVGKGLFTAQLVAYVTTGRTSEIFSAAREQTGNVVILAGEDSVDTVLCPRLKAVEADFEKIQVAASNYYYRMTGKTPYLDDESLWARIESVNPSLVVVDPIQSFLPPNINMNNRQQMRGLLQKLQGMAQECGFSLLLVMHTNKGTGASGRNRMNGTADFWDAARSVLMMGHELNSDRVYLSNEKNSYSEPAQTMLFTMETVETEKGMKAVRLAFDETTERKDADFVCEKPEKAAGKSETVQRMILSVLNESPEKKMESIALKNEVIAQIGCSGSTYDHARSALTKDGLIRNEKQGKGYTALNQDRATVRVA